MRAALGRGVDHVIVCTGARDAVVQSLEAADRGGKVLFFAPMDPQESYALPFNEVFWRNDVTLLSSYGAAPRDLREAVDWIDHGVLDVTRLVTHRLPLGEIGRGFQMMVAGRESLKIIIDPRLDAPRAPRSAYAEARA